MPPTQTCENVNRMPRPRLIRLNQTAGSLNKGAGPHDAALEDHQRHNQKAAIGVGVEQHSGKSHSTVARKGIRQPQKVRSQKTRYRHGILDRDTQSEYSKNVAYFIPFHNRGADGGVTEKRE